MVVEEHAGQQQPSLHVPAAIVRLAKCVLLCPLLCSTAIRSSFEAHRRAEQPYHMGHMASSVRNLCERCTVFKNERSPFILLSLAISVEAQSVAQVRPGLLLPCSLIKFLPCQMVVVVESLPRNGRA